MNVKDYKRPFSLNHSVSRLDFLSSHRFLFFCGKILARWWGVAKLKNYMPRFSVRYNVCEFFHLKRCFVVLVDGIQQICGINSKERIMNEERNGCWMMGTRVTRISELLQTFLSSWCLVGVLIKDSTFLYENRKFESSYTANVSRLYFLKIWGPFSLPLWCSSQRAW